MSEFRNNLRDAEKNISTKFSGNLHFLTSALVEEIIEDYNKQNKSKFLVNPLMNCHELYEQNDGKTEPGEYGENMERVSIETVIILREMAN